MLGLVFERLWSWLNLQINIFKIFLWVIKVIMAGMLRSLNKQYVTITVVE